MMERDDDGGSTEHSNTANLLEGTNQQHGPLSTENQGHSASKAKKIEFASIPPPQITYQDPSSLRACVNCNLIKTLSDFGQFGCDNCVKYLDVAVAGQMTVDEFISEDFEGLIGMINPEDSWVAKRLNIDQLKPGLYAINVIGPSTSTISPVAGPGVRPGHLGEAKARNIEEKCQLEQIPSISNSENTEEKIFLETEDRNQLEPISHQSISPGKLEKETAQGIVEMGQSLSSLLGFKSVKVENEILGAAGTNGELKGISHYFSTNEIEKDTFSGIEESGQLERLLREKTGPVKTEEEILLEMEERSKLEESITLRSVSSEKRGKNTGLSFEETTPSEDGTYQRTIHPDKLENAIFELVEESGQSEEKQSASPSKIKIDPLSGIEESFQLQVISHSISPEELEKKIFPETVKNDQFESTSQETSKLEEEIFLETERNGLMEPTCQENPESEIFKRKKNLLEQISQETASSDKPHEEIFRENEKSILPEGISLLIISSEEHEEETLQDIGDIIQLERISHETISSEKVDEGIFKKGNEESHQLEGIAQKTTSSEVEDEIFLETNERGQLEKTSHQIASSEMLEACTEESDRMDAISQQSLQNLEVETDQESDGMGQGIFGSEELQVAIYEDSREIGQLEGISQESIISSKAFENDAESGQRLEETLPTTDTCGLPVEREEINSQVEGGVDLGECSEQPCDIKGLIDIDPDVNPIQHLEARRRLEIEEEIPYMHFNELFEMSLNHTGLVPFRSGKVYIISDDEDEDDSDSLEDSGISSGTTNSICESIESI